MTAAAESVFLYALGWAVLNSLWQMALLWGIFQFISGVTKSKPSQKSTLATLLLIAGFAWFLYTLISVLTHQTFNSSLIESGIAGSTINEKLIGWLQQTLPAAAITYMVLLVFPIIQFWRNYRYIKTIQNEGLSKINVDWRIFAVKMASLMGIKKKVQVWVSEFVNSPVTIGFLKPVILVPIAAVNSLTTQQMEAVLLHELSHIKRHDYLLNLIVNGIRAILYFNPFVKLFIKSIEREREKSCDEMVIQFQYDPCGYATALLLLQKASHYTKPLVVAASGNKNDLLHRIEMILGIKSKPVFSFNRLAILFGGLLFAIGFNAILISGKQSPGDNSSIALSQYSGFHYFLPEDKIPAPEKPWQKPLFAISSKSKPVANSVIENKPEQKLSKASDRKLVLRKPKHLDLNPYSSELIKVAYKLPISIPQLKNYQELQVKKALAASKLIIQDAQWNSINKKIADALTKKEKDNVKTLYQKAIDKYDWHSLENKLRLAYTKIDWDRINEQLGKALTDIKLDSLQKVYMETINSLDLVLEIMKESNQPAITDTDITVQVLEQNKQKLLKALNSIRGMRTRKIIHL